MKSYFSCQCFAQLERKQVGLRELATPPPGNWLPPPPPHPQGIGQILYPFFPFSNLTFDKSPSIRGSWTVHQRSHQSHKKSGTFAKTLVLVIKMTKNLFCYCFLNWCPLPPILFRRENIDKYIAI